MGGYIGAKTGTLVASASDIRGDISATDTTPEITLKNTTETDADGGREGTVTFKGEKSGGEEVTLAQIEGSHDSTNDDSRGQLVFKTNNNQLGDNVTEAKMTIDSVGDVDVTSGAPSITITNTTHEDTDGGREGKLKFKGEQSGGELSTLAQIEASHDGTADDEKGDLIFKTNDGSDGASPTERVRIDSDGNVGIGRSSPTAGLHLEGADGTTKGTIMITSTGVASSGMACDANGLNFGADTGGFVFKTGATAADPTDTGTERMRVDTSGNLNIGSDTNVGYGPLQIGSTSLASPIIQFLSTATGNNSIHFGDATSGGGRYAGYLNYRHNGDSFEIATAGGERVRVNSTGKLLVGKTTDAAAATGIILGAGNVGAYSTISSGNTWHVHDTSSYKFYVNSNGGIYNYQANDGNLSDEREKKNIETLDNKWDAVKAWSLKKFHYNSEEDSDPKKIGVIAQDLETDNPELVSDFILTPSQEEIIDEDGNVTSEASDAVTRKSVKEQQMMWMAIKALQEAMTRIETLETKVAALEAE